MKFSQVSTNSAPALVDYLMGVTAAGVDFRVTLTNLITVLLKAQYVSNPYKFSVYRAATFSSSGSMVPMDTKTFDTNNNYSTSTGLYTVPETGFYYFDTQMTHASGNFTYLWATIFKNGVEYRRGNRLSASTAYASGAGVWSMALMSLTAGDTVSFGFATNTSVTLEVGDQLKTIAEGFMVSKT